MRKILGARFLFAAATFGALGVWVACGGSDDNQDVIQQDAGSDTGSGNKDTGSPFDNDTGAVQDTGAPDVVSQKGFCDLNDCDAGAPTILDSGDVDGGIACVVGGQLEEEPNDTQLLANKLDPTRCGVISSANPDGGDAGDVDFYKFVLADASNQFFLQFAGKVKVLVQADGSAPVDITQPDASLAFTAGQPYFVEVLSADGNQQVYRVTLFQK